ncbi:hypothetical protein SELMODRAFT_134638 [Selaginella moellendorffii]|uniref:Uncharacterized protein SHB1A-2 n=1 Tax=Selaginella moellendorffii TaxID=88036 RepID=D8T8X0_SELML|nr:phosphate transporter PHO1 homolog 3 [Selaginella moellendorffii]EFJ06905.1 hypothetical protein SELMODRAFT_134638 [Selaginella moellendorffii]|eukprot:XP_002992056.1 phosphate transporter PHO1 homolog 3 [Selaginella moellendorffii]
MKFGKQFETQQVPEWREAYLDYRHGKEIVKHMAKIKKQSHEESEPQLSRRISNFRRLVTGFQHAHSPRGARSPTSPEAREEEMILIEPKQTSDGMEFQTAFLGVGSPHNELERTFFRLLDEELAKLNKFYKSKEKELVTQAAALDSQMEALLSAKKSLNNLDSGNEESNASSHGHLSVVEEDGGSVRQIKIDIPAAKPADALAALFAELANKSITNLNSRRLKRAEEMLQNAFVEFYKGLYILRNFCSLNIIAFSKLLKKYNKVTQRNLGRKYMKAVEDSYIGQSEIIQKLMEKVEVLFTKHFTDSNRRDAMQVLRPEARKERHRISFFVGVFFGLSVALLVSLVLTIRVERLYVREYAMTYMNAVFPIFSMLTAVLLHFFLYGLNIYMWRRTRINHTFILGLNRKSELRFRDVFLLATGLSTLALSGLILHLQLTAGERCCQTYQEMIPLLVVAGMVVLLCMPFNILYRATRYFFLNALWHCLLTPFYKVIITDFLLADQLTSQVPALRDLEYVLCYFGGGFFKDRNSNACLKNPTFITFGFVMALLPYWCRFSQCLRRWYDEKDVMQLYNALKYFSAILAVAARLAYGYHKDPLLLGFTIAISATAAIVSTYWDLVYDWGLLERNSANPWLRDKLAIPYKSVYYFAIVSNILLRFAWLQSLIPISMPGINPKGLSLIVASLEVIRRGQWNYYRLENEHFNNVGKFRAVKSVPLPFVD